MKTGEALGDRDILQDPRWQAVLIRNKTADGGFIYGVKTTGIYCSPSCPSRLPRPENIVFFRDAAAAELAGFRPYKRCRQGRPSLSAEQSAKIALACRSIERAEPAPTLRRLAQEAGISPYHFHRLFKSMTGLTPKTYAGARRRPVLRRSRCGAGYDADRLPGWGAGHGHCVCGWTLFVG